MRATGYSVWRRARAVAPAAGLALASAFFLWMFMVSDALERSAASGAFAGEAGIDVEAAGHDYAERWRHGTSGWPLFVPGFFAIAFVVPFWARQRSARDLLPSTALLLPAAIGARLTGGQFTSRLAGGFAEHYRLEQTGGLEEPSLWVGVPASLTIVAFVALLVSARIAVRRRSPVPAMVPLVLYFGLAGVRGGGAFGELASAWLGALWELEPAAVVSSGLFVAMCVWVLAPIERWRQSVRPLVRFRDAEVRPAA